MRKLAFQECANCVWQVVRCKMCKHWKSPRVRLANGRERQYRPDDMLDEICHRYITAETGINVGGQCWVEYNRGWAEDKTVFRNENDFCSRGELRPCSYEDWWGIDKDGFYPEKM